MPPNDGRRQVRLPALRLRAASVFRSIRFAMRYTLYRLSILRAGIFRLRHRCEMGAERDPLLISLPQMKALSARRDGTGEPCGD